MGYCSGLPRSRSNRACRCLVRQGLRRVIAFEDLSRDLIDCFLQRRVLYVGIEFGLHRGEPGLGRGEIPEQPLELGADYRRGHPILRAEIAMLARIIERLEGV